MTIICEIYVKKGQTRTAIITHIQTYFMSIDTGELDSLGHDLIFGRLYRQNSFQQCEVLSNNIRGSVNTSL